VKKLQGKYTYHNSLLGIEFYFNSHQNEFDYFQRSEMGLLQYSKGKWELDDNKVYLIGFNVNNLKTLDVKSIINENTSNNQTVFEVNYDAETGKNYIKSILLVNSDKIYTITGDTTFTTNYKVELIQVKSYLSHADFLLSSPAKIDTLSSPQINLKNSNHNHKSIALSFSVKSYDFARVLFRDTLVIKNNHMLLQNKNKFIKTED
jgi:asparagine N-glycosylation enzyme membrane subunit Stt3